IGRLRVLVTVPQRSTQWIHVGQSAEITVQELPKLKFRGTLTRTTESLDAGSRNLIAEVQADNPKGILLPGMYVLVNFITERPEPPVLVPDAALVVRASGTQVAVMLPLTSQEKAKLSSKGLDSEVISRSRRAHFQPVELGRNLGVELEILSGIHPSDEV